VTGILCETRAVAELHELKIPKAMRQVAEYAEAG
jgi:hypothetical protein